MLIDKLKSIAGLQVFLNEPLKEYTSFKIGGPADIFLLPTTIESLQQALPVLQNYQLPLFILGKGSNIIVGDKGFRGVVIYTGQLKRVEVAGQELIAEAGITLAALAKQAMEASLSGLEFASGIPGTLGGAIYMNAGAYGGEMKDVVQEVQVLKPDGQLQTLSKEELKFSYRYSLLQERDYIAVRARLALQKGKQEEIKAYMQQLNRQRWNKQPLNWPSAGSAFKRPKGYYAGPLIEKAGLKGYRIGDAQVSLKHAGFIINKGQATASDVIKLMKKIQKEVYKISGVRLKPEPRFIGEFNEKTPD